MESSLKKKAQSLPRLRKLEFQEKRDNLAKLFAKESPSDFNGQKNNQENPQLSYMDPEQSRKQKVNQILLKSKSMIEQNKDKIEVAKKFRILKKKSTGAFLTGVDIYKEEESPKHYACQQSPQNGNDESLRKLLSEKYDDLAELRKMIKKTSKNLGAYKHQTLSIQKNLITMADRYGDVAMDVLSRKKLNLNVQNYEEEV